ncbi:MAG: alpha/beta fold hydrolase [Candidatus Electryonea clarkiae]|nr:alpha/beta fold hydrolase [Candidatus Electryonea clarkiae]MDP8285536.1 alpha/beta fold hydrolase [Candidatus Electryonea clarkiae]
MPSQKISFKNSSGEDLVAWLESPDNEKPLAYAIFAHCFTCSKDYKAVFHISRILRSEGIAVLRFDFTGLGESSGDFSDTNFASNIHDLLDAAKFLEDSFESPKLLIGHSLGGAAVLQVADLLPFVKAVVTIAAPADLNHLRDKLMIRAGSDDGDGGGVEVTISGRKFKLERHFFESLEQSSMTKVIRKLDKALLVIHSLSDEIVSVNNGEQIFENAKYPKSFLGLINTDHLLSNEEDAKYVGSVIAAWVKGFLSAG